MQKRFPLSRVRNLWLTSYGFYLVPALFGFQGVSWRRWRLSFLVSLSVPDHSLRARLSDAWNARFGVDKERYRAGELPMRSGAVK